ncbi:MAG: hypothetical protein PF440_07120 [Thiomicrorhabdus sp.]|jgi:hypothetical protein|nr:hypothetical protein [Thiomicrorhabdus sp.]
MISIANFKGIVPRIANKLLPSNYASDAVNCDLREGQIKPTKIADSIFDLAVGTKTIHRLSDQWLQWTNLVDVVKSLIYESGSRILYTGDGYPKETNAVLAISGASTYPAGSRRLGIDAPTIKLTHSITVVGTGTDRSVAYVYTRVGEWTDGSVVESSPSPPTEVFTAKDDSTVHLTAFVDSTETGIYTTHYRIYRINTGNTGAEYQYVDDLIKSASPLEYDDTVDDADLGEVLPTTDWTFPIEDLQGIIESSNGLIFGHSANKVYPSETFITYTFPSEYALSVDSEVVGLGYTGNAVIVLTKTRPYMIFGVDPSSLSLEQLPYDLPCMSKRSIVNTPKGVIYASNAGLTLVSSNGGVSNLTEDLYTPAQWQALNPAGIFAFYYNDAYILFFDDTIHGIEFPLKDLIARKIETEAEVYGGEYVSTVAANSYDLLDSDSKNFITDGGYQFVVSGDTYSLTLDTLYLIQKKGTISEIVAWEGGALQDYTWESKEFYVSYKTVLMFGMVVGDYTDGDVDLTLYIDGVAQFTKTISSQEVFNLPTTKRGSNYKLKLVGKTEIDKIVIGQSVPEVLNG